MVPDFRLPRSRAGVYNYVRLRFPPRCAKNLRFRDATAAGVGFHRSERERRFPLHATHVELLFFELNIELFNLMKTGCAEVAPDAAAPPCLFDCAVAKLGVDRRRPVRGTFRATYIIT